MKPIPEVDQHALKESEKKHHDVLAEDEPVVLESSEYDPEFPALEEYEVDEDGPKGTHNMSAGMIWLVIAVVAIVVSCIVFAAVGDWS